MAASGGEKFVRVRWSEEGCAHLPPGEAQLNEAADERVGRNTDDEAYPESGEVPGGKRACGGGDGGEVCVDERGVWVGGLTLLDGLCQCVHLRGEKVEVDLRTITSLVI